MQYLNQHDSKLAAILDRSFHRDENGQLYYASPGSPIKLPVEESEYDDALVRLLGRTTMVRRVLMSVYVAGAAVLLALVIASGFDRAYLTAFAMAFVGFAMLFFWSSALAGYSAVYGLEKRRIAAGGGLPLRKKISSALLWALAAVVGYYVVYTNL